MVTWLPFLVFALLSTSVLAGVCGGNQNSVSIPSLQVQDQDGLGTCYANQASLLIQNALGRSRPVSYQQLGMAYAGHLAELNNQSNSSLVSLNNRREQRFVSEGGFGCQAFAAAREQGFCDSRAFQALERSGTEDPQRVQAYYLTLLGGFFDSQRRSLRGVSEEGWANLENNLAAFLVEQRQSCEMSQDDYLAVSFGARSSELLTAASSVEQACTIRYPLCNKNVTPAEAASLRGALADFRSRYYSEDRTPIPNGHNIRLNSEAVGQLRSRSLTTNNWGRAFSELLSSDVASALAQTLPAQRARELAQSLLPTDAVNSAAETARRARIPRVECTDPWAAYATLTRRGFDAGQATRRAAGCYEPGVLSQQSLNEIQQFASRVTASLQEQQSGNLRERLRSLISIIAPRCAEQLESNRAQLNNLTCKQILLSDVLGQVRGPHVQADPALIGANVSASARRRSAETQIESALCAGRAVGVDVCTAFMDSATAVDSDFCRRPLPGIEGHGYHAMTIVSSEVLPNGKKRYLVQNSWGRTCDFPLTQNGSGLMSCEYSGIRTTGRFWVDGDLLINNTVALNVLQGR